MKRLLVGVVAGCMLLHPALVAAQTIPAPLLQAPASIDQKTEGPLMTALRRQSGGLTVIRPDERSPLQPGPVRPRDERSWIGRHPALFGALVGAAAGTVAVGTMENDLFCSAGNDEDCFFYTNSRFAVGAGIGAGVGALVGWIASRAR
jgi:hypothetical protein